MTGLNTSPDRRPQSGYSARSGQQSVRGIIFDIMRFAVNDGPGIRTTVFLKGCLLSCWWCHNPEGLHRGIEMAYRVERCTLCGECIDACPQRALGLEETRVVRDEDQCVVCASCATECYGGAHEQVGREISVEELLAELLKDRVFYDESGGGVTFSGGEPLFQYDFLLAALKACKGAGLHTVLETSGLAATDHLEQVRAYTDLFLYDVKVVDDERHKRLTGVSNHRIMENLRHLASAGTALTVRVPLIPGVNDDDGNLDGLAALLSELKTVRDIHLLPYHTGAAAKYRSLGMRSRMPNVHPLPGERVQAIADMLSGRGFTVTIRG
jgi:pyruvate formate lyase activating enzyme